MCAELEKLQTQAPEHSFKYSKVAIESALGMPMEDLFDVIDPAPVASGSIGQIHRAVLSKKGAGITGCTPGQVVAVKVRHPGVAETISSDFEAMLWVAHLFSGVQSIAHLRLEDTLKQFAAPLKEQAMLWVAHLFSGVQSIAHLRLEDTLKQFAAPLREQVDLAREADNLQRFNYNFRNAESVSFPVPLFPLVSSDVLVETFEGGDHINSYIQSKHNPHNHRLSVLGSGTMLQQRWLELRQVNIIGLSLAGEQPVLFEKAQYEKLLAEVPKVCFAELNLLCNTYFSQMPASFLRGYHSYTRLPKDMLWSRFISPLGNPPPSQDSLKTQEKMTGFLMEHLFTNQPEAGIVKYTLKAPEWLIEWGTRWGLMSTNGIVNVLAVMAYAPGDASSSSGTSPAQAFYVPAFE
eukprot:gene2143-18192_t